MSIHRRAVGQALQRVPHREREEVLKASQAAAIDALSSTEARQIPAMAGGLARAVDRMGPITALEVLASIGMLWSEEGR